MLDKEDFENIAWLCAFQGWHFHVGEEAGQLFFQVQVDGRDNVTGEPKRWAGRPWILSPEMSRSEFVRPMFKAVLTALEHEARETFLYAGQPVFDPHFDVDTLWALQRERQEETCAEPSDDHRREIP